MRYTFITAILLMLPFTAGAADKVAVLPVSYTMYKTDSPSEERALRVAEAVATGVERAGFEPVMGDEVTAQSRELAEGGAKYCEKATCARKVAESVGAVSAVFVSVLDKDGKFDIEVLSTDADLITASPFGTFRSMTRRVSGLVETSIREALGHRLAQPTTAVSDDASEPEPEPAPAEPEASTTEDAATIDQADPTTLEYDEKGIKPAPFIVSSVVTGGLFAGWLALELVGGKKLDTADTPDDREDLKPLQTSSRALLGATAAGVVTSVVLFFLTDFRSDERASDQTTWSVIPAPTRNGGGFILETRF